MASLHATQPGERIEALDILRGAALLGVLLVNLTTGFRVSLLQHLREFHTHPGQVNRAVDLLIGVFIESKSFALFSLLFGVGLALQAGRVAERGGRPLRLLCRRLLVLLGIGLVHMIVIWNGDILTLYAVVALLLLPTLWLPDRPLLLLAAGLLLWPCLPVPQPFEVSFAGLGDHVAEANRIYAGGGLGETFLFRQRETQRLIVQLLLGVSLRTGGLMLLGQYLVRRRILQEPEAHRRLLVGVAAVGIPIGIGVNFGQAAAAYAHVDLGLLGRPADGLSTLLPAFGYGALGLLLLQRPGLRRVLSPVAAVGRMALTCYLMQSVVLSVIFYGYGGWGLGLFGKLGAAVAVLIGLALYGVQMAGCRRWLRRYAFGPVEWLWRSLTYGAVQRMRKSPSPPPSPHS